MINLILFDIPLIHYKISHIFIIITYYSIPNCVISSKHVKKINKAGQLETPNLISSVNFYLSY